MLELRQTVARYVARRVPPADVDDVVQEVFVRYARTETEPDNLEAWMVRVALNVVTDHLRRSGREVSLEVEPHAPTEEQDNLQILLAAWIANEVESLPAPYAETLRGTELEGRPHQAVAEELGVAVGTVKARVHRGRVILRERLNACCAIELDARKRVLELNPRQDCC